MQNDLDTSTRLLLSRRTRNTYLADADLTLPESPLPLGEVLLPSFSEVQVLAYNMNLKKDLRDDPQGAVRPGEIGAFGLLTEVLETVIHTYREEVEPRVLELWEDALGQGAGQEQQERLLVDVARLFPSTHPPEPHPEAEVLRGSLGPISNRQRALVTFLLTWVSNENPSTGSFRDLFEQEALGRLDGYLELIRATRDFFARQPTIGPDGQTLVEMLLAPSRHSPGSLLEQLEYVKDRWRAYLDERLLRRLVLAQDRLREDWKWSPPPTQAANIEAPYFAPDAGRSIEPGRFAREASWKPRVILMAKNVRVWLDQLSRSYQRPITRLDQIPVEVLQQLADWGFTCLWLIGLWERSPASQKIKQLTGNPEALGSAYSLYDYVIAEDLGGDGALDVLKERANGLGIRLAADMVPNHVGLLSRWVIDHPDWFVSLNDPPFPGYRFEGHDLSNHPDIGLTIEDGYWNRTDAAVVFKRLDRRTGEATYIYHGNDGTQMPWNDTAQLDFRKPEVRRAVIEVILKVLKKFPFLRFDAAMTLTRFHYQRLWFPQPGTGGTIPSRAEHGMTTEAFNEAMPVEFWREVVDTVAREVPDSLLMAEAFWLTEEFFIRTLGMHRVYNSAFMNMLRNEDNDKYRGMIKDILVSDPEVLYQLVNFLTNPDEETAIAGFGKGDKYFGILTILVTLPGLPMFGHGQIEGFEEKYGMEYRRAYRDEQPDAGFVARHEAEIFPLTKMRSLFAAVEQFELYDFIREDGSVDENVFAYSNRAGNQWALVVYNNRLETTRGCIRRTCAKVRWTEGHSQIEQKTLIEALGLNGASGGTVRVHEMRTRMDSSFELQHLNDRGMDLTIPGYQCRIFLGNADL